MGKRPKLLSIYYKPNTVLSPGVKYNSQVHGDWIPQGKKLLTFAYSCDKCMNKKYTVLRDSVSGSSNYSYGPNPANCLFLYSPQAKNGFKNFKWFHFKWLLYRYPYNILDFAYWATKSKIFSIWFFTGKICRLLFYTREVWPSWDDKYKPTKIYKCLWNKTVKYIFYMSHFIEKYIHIYSELIWK